MEREAYYLLGKIRKSVGGKGHLLVFLDVDDPGRYNGLDHVYIGIEHERIPFPVESLEIRTNNRIILKFEDVDTASDAEPFIGRSLYLPLSFLPKLKGNKFYYHEVTGFRVVDELRGVVGTLVSVIDLPAHSLLQVDHNGHEVLIPLTDEILVRVERKKREIRVRVPEGLPGLDP